MKPGRIRPIAICIIWRGASILVAEGYDEVKRQTFYRPLGGAIEFGEYSRDTVCREFQEELGLDVEDLRYLGMFENVFIFNGKPGHEIVIVYQGKLADPAAYEMPEIEGREDDGMAFKGVWKPLSAFSSETPLYPEGLAELLVGDVGDS